MKALYKAQNYRIHEADEFFVTELKYGTSTYFDAVFAFVKFGDTVKRDELYPLPHLVRSSGYNITRIVIVTNAQLEKDCDEFLKTERLTVKTKEELLRGLFDFEPYRKDLLQHVHSEQLSTHYIEVYSTTELPKDKEGDVFQEASDTDAYGDDEYIYLEDREPYEEYDIYEDDEDGLYEEPEYSEGIPGKTAAKSRF